MVTVARPAPDAESTEFQADHCPLPAAAPAGVYARVVLPAPPPLDDDETYFDSTDDHTDNAPDAKSALSVWLVELAGRYFPHEAFIDTRHCFSVITSPEALHEYVPGLKVNELTAI